MKQIATVDVNTRPLRPRNAGEQFPVGCVTNNFFRSCLSLSAATQLSAVRLTFPTLPCGTDRSRSPDPRNAPIHYSHTLISLLIIGGLQNPKRGVVTSYTV
jgi:hypothetical protein